jgi:hypothetical protein
MKTIKSYKNFKFLSLIIFYCTLFTLFTFVSFTSFSFAGGLYPLGETSEVSRLSDKPLGLLKPSNTGNRPALPLEIGDPFLEIGNLSGGFELPTGAVWQPRLWGFGTLRSAVQTFDNGVNETESQWANRLDLYANLQLTGTEKVLIGIRPLDKNSIQHFNRLDFDSSSNQGYEGEFNGDIRALFFEGDFGSLFPNLDSLGIKPIDYGFSIGRQTLQFQEGILLNDTIDSLGIVRNNIRLPGISNLRVSGVWGWHQLDRNDFRKNDADMFGLFSSADTFKTTYNLDLIYVNDELPNSDGFYLGFSAIRRFGQFNTSFRINSSFALESETQSVGDGTLLSSEVSWTPYSSDDIMYFNSFFALDRFTQAGREPIIGGPLAALGILFASPLLGDFASELANTANDVAGFSLGYQAFWNKHRTSLTLETSGRIDVKRNDVAKDNFAFGLEFRQRLFHRVQFQFDAHVSVQEDRDDGYGARSEIFIQF